MSMLFRCPRRACDAIFVGQFTLEIATGGRDEWVLQRCLPQTAANLNFSGHIDEISPAFVEVFRQALEGEAHGLNEIAGPGFRKSLEFLVKDYLIHCKPEDAETIKAMPLANCVKQRVADRRIKDCAERAVWLGNDETHYEKRLSSSDIRDLKRLILLTVNWIDSEFLTEEFVRDISKPT